MCVIFSSSTLGRFSLKCLVVICCSAVALLKNSAIAQIIPDATLPNNSSVQAIHNLKIINGGTQAGSNLFHSFEEFSIPDGAGAYFNNKLDIQNIISRVTGSKISNINGVIRANGTEVNLFFLNPNGIIFGNNAELNIGGSFIASTASSLNFADGNKFNASDTRPLHLLTVSVPTGLQFGKIANPIRLTSQAGNATNRFGSPVGLQVRTGKTLALIGGDVILSGGNLTAAEGQIELLSVGSDSKVSLQPNLSGWVFEIGDVTNFQDIQFLEQNGIPSIVDVSGEGSGTISVQGKRVLFTGASSVLSITYGSKSGNNLTVTATESVELTGNGTPLMVGTESVGNASDLIITAKNLIIKNGAQILSYSGSSGAGGRLIINTSDFLELIGGYSFIFPGTSSNNFIPSSILSIAYAAGNAGEIEVNAGHLYLKDGARISTESLGNYFDNQYIPATRQGANLTVNVRDSIELIGNGNNGEIASGLFTSTQGSGNAGDLKLNTRQLVVRDSAVINVSSRVENFLSYKSNEISNLGSSGNLEIQANSIILDNQGKLIAETDLGKGGNINLQVQNLLNLRRNSQISTSAGKAQAIGDGGNITINAPNGFIIAHTYENSDITANAFTGAGGNIQINATGIFGIVPRGRNDLTKVFGTTDPLKIEPQGLPTSDITAISQQNPTLNGQVNINTFEFDPNRGLAQLPTEPSEPKLAQTCIAQAGRNASKFSIVGRQGLPVNPKDYLRNTNISDDWISLPTDVENTNLNTQQKIQSSSTHSSIINLDTPIVEAKGWIIDKNNDVVLVEEAPAPTGINSLFTQAHCNTQ
ncbi:filamentous hemagglutinin N-terminal domain-containing protein [Dulcicalothrix desertica]|uniref:two-partner secretion domain-containing protein n=1 Tax=Dulcicalothrix desertica TaxID=32056 RepID=UPI001199BEA9|nr:filamentous hemagglutinin N-terminal domain-containing protein [Dulcicalothrix desertica]TWH55400.1 filamentous hemagglutinin family protein [Dulcicalothrix desertica PCC 7102]